MSYIQFFVGPPQIDMLRKARGRDYGTAYYRTIHCWILVLDIRQSWNHLPFGTEEQSVGIFCQMHVHAARHFVRSNTFWNCLPQQKCTGWILSGSGKWISLIPHATCTNTSTNTIEISSGKGYSATLSTQTYNIQIHTYVVIWITHRPAIKNILQLKFADDGIRNSLGWDAIADVRIEQPAAGRNMRRLSANQSAIILSNAGWNGHLYRTRKK